MSLKAAFADQAEACRALGSPFMGQLMDLLAADWPADSALALKLGTYEGDIGPRGHSLPLRVASGLHALVLKRLDADLVAAYPPATVSDTVLRKAVLGAIDRHGAFLIDWTASAPQTNEVRRAAVLIAGAAVAVKHFDLPILLSELGASAGLNLLWDQYALDIKGTRFGPSLPALILTPDWSGPLPPANRAQIAARAGVDLNPLDLRRHDHLLRLMSYLWPDQPDRLAKTRTAASLDQAPVLQADAVDWLATRMHQAAPGQLHLIQHTIAWQYFPATAQARGRALITAAGAKATAKRPLAWLGMENDGDPQGLGGAAITLRLWPGDIHLTLGRADFHGRWVNWTYDA
tara:strand:- start:23152 stop:24192 length:1041 start_codon:yes stop_codon:yes gene_type:complete